MVSSKDILEKFYEAMKRDSKDNDDEEIHVSSLCYDCMRKVYYQMTRKEQYFDLKTMITFWMGRAIHNTPILKESEIPLKWKGIVGTCDEYEDGVLLEKKTCTKIPMNPNQHHVKQTEYYAFMLNESKRPVTQAFVAYIDLANREIQPFEVRLRDMEDIKVEMLRKKEQIEFAMRNKVLPERSIGWLCSYCNFSQLCFGNIK
jgi:CRISPR/Cas system-associated exonuclease Cas4 (RecB family)